MDSDSSAGPPATGRRNKGQSLVEAFRLSRIAQRPALRTELHDSRQALRQGRAARLGAGRPPPAQTPDAAPAEATETTKAASPEPAVTAEIGGSIFAGFCGAVDAAAAMDEAARQANAPPDEGPHSPQAELTAEARLPLSAIGFGPGMTMRMRQLGIETVSELASSDPVWLRNALGEISQLINVDLWIANARQAARGEASEPET
jgi:hypothetical protein